MAVNDNDQLKRSREKVRELFQAVTDARKVLILTHDNPDPDSLAGSAALRFILRREARRESIIAYGGTIGRSENRALARSLRAELRPVRDVDVRKYRVVALIDAQPQAGNNSLPRDMIPRIVIDHHQARKASWAARFTDIRPDYGAASTILTEYIQVLGIPLSTGLATALFYGIKSDTRNLDRSGNEADIRAFNYLFPMVDQARLGAIEHSRVSRHHFEMMKRAIDNAVIYGDLVLSVLGEVESADDVAACSDELIRLESMLWAAALGIQGGDIYISLRSGGRARNAGRMLKRAVGRLGAAGGHGMMAGAKVPLKGAADQNAEELVRRLTDRLVENLSGRGREGRSLVNRPIETPAAESGK